jgi:hypothetical protein
MMDIQSSTLNELFKLHPVIIMGWVTPVRPAGIAQVGIPKSLYDDQPKGLECLIDPWVLAQSHSWTLEADDRADLYLNDEPAPVTGDTVRPGEESLRMRLYVPHRRLRHGVNRLYYKVTRASGGDEVSDDLTFLYHLRAPGEPAPEGLELLIPADVIDEGVSAERAAQGVTFGFDYSNRRPYDRIQFLLGDATDEWEIADGAPVPEVRTLFTDKFQEAGDNRRAQVEFRVLDQLGNSSQSSVYVLDIHLNRLAPPEITSVKDGKEVEIPHGASTVETAVMLSGTASGDKGVDIFDGADFKGSAHASSDGIWNFAVIGLALGEHSFTAKALYGSGQVSSARDLTVAFPLSFGDAYVMATQNYVIADHRLPNNPIPSSNASYTRVAVGGVPPHKYSSSNPQVAVVDADTGYVRAAGNGQAQITVTDGDGVSASYTITVSGVQIVSLLVSVMWGQGGVLEEAVYDAFIGNYRHEGDLPSILGWPNSWYWARRGHENQTHGVVRDLAGGSTLQLKSSYFPAVQHLR